MEIVFSIVYIIILFIAIVLPFFCVILRTIDEERKRS